MTYQIFLFIFFLSFLFTSKAQAYIDPGTFSIIFQAIVGAIVAGGVAIKVYWHKFKSFFKKKDKDEKKSN
tara:strand:- start:271 stop:480 length:210 start_codon:yes stop_codon:yes gene_type:complete